MSDCRVLTAALAAFLVILFALLAADRLVAAGCAEHGGVWDDTAGRCVLP